MGVRVQGVRLSPFYLCCFSSCNSFLVSNHLIWNYTEWFLDDSFFTRAVHAVGGTDARVTSGYVVRLSVRCNVDVCWSYKFGYSDSYSEFSYPYKSSTEMLHNTFVCWSYFPQHLNCFAILVLPANNLPMISSSRS